LRRGRSPWKKVADAGRSVAAPAALRVSQTAFECIPKAGSTGFLRLRCRRVSCRQSRKCLLAVPEGEPRLAATCGRDASPAREIIRLRAPGGGGLISSRRIRRWQGCWWKTGALIGARKRRAGRPRTVARGLFRAERWRNRFREGHWHRGEFSRAVRGAPGRSAQSA